MGDVMGIVDSDGVWLEKYQYDAWGKMISSKVNDEDFDAVTTAARKSGGNNMLYRGYYYDTATEMYYLQSRYYSPDQFRFLNPDLPEFAKQLKDDYAGTNLFAYCGNNPVNNSDPEGMYAYQNVYVIYDKKNFATQASHEAGKWRESSGRYKVITAHASYNSSLINYWNNTIRENSIVVLIFHGWPYGITIVNNYFKSNNVKSLKNKRLSTLYIYACNCGHKDINNNIAKVLKKHLTNTKNIYAMDGSISYYPKGHYYEYKYYKPRLSVNQSSFYNYATLYRYYSNGRWNYYYRVPTGLYRV